MMSNVILDKLLKKTIHSEQEKCFRKKYGASFKSLIAVMTGKS